MYKSLRIAFGYLSNELYSLTWEEYKDLLNSRIRNDMTFRQNLRKEISGALDDNNFSWKILADQNSIFFNDDLKTDGDILFHLKLLVWQELFPHELASIDVLEQLYERVVEILRQRKNNDNKKWVLLDDILDELQGYSEFERVNQLSLVRMYKLIERTELQLDYVVPELWFFKLDLRLQ